MPLKKCLNSEALWRQRYYQVGNKIGTIQIKQIVKIINSIIIKY